MENPTEMCARALKQFADRAAKHEQGLRLSVALLGAAISLQPDVDSRKLLADFDRFLDDIVPADQEIPVAALDVRTALVKVVEGLAKNGRE
jgi:hypothetical protein